MANEKTFNTLSEFSWGAADPTRDNETMTTISGVAGPVDADSVQTQVDLGPEEGEVQAVVGELPKGEMPLVIGVQEVPERFERLDLLGLGGMGEVYRVRDTLLRRTVALKVLRPELLKSKKAMRLFEEEAQVASQLQHPGIIPIHDIGRMADGRVWFTMKEVHGDTLEQMLVSFHQRGAKTEYDLVVLRRLLDGVQRVCETVAYAHERGVIHRDLKPANIMVGAFGEVLVLDWGLAKVLASEQDDTETPAGAMSRIATSRSLSDVKRTKAGAVSGTPAYMPPEQARGQQHLLGPPADVYALGALLYDLLCGRPPYEAKSVRGMLDQVISAEPFPRPVELSPFAVDEALEAIVLKALSARMQDRYPTAAGLADALRDWLDGAQKRERAMALVHEARSFKTEADTLESQAKWKAQDAEAAIKAVDPLAEESAKWAGWALDEQAQEAFAKAEQTKAEATQLLRSALSHAPDLPEAHDDLAAVFHAEHRKLESNGLEQEAKNVEVALRAHNRGKYTAYLKGTGSVSLITDPPGADVGLYKYKMVRRRLQPVFVKSLGKTPIEKVPLEMGSYLLKVGKEGHQEVLYPVFIQRQQHWDGVPPQGGAPVPIWLPKVGELDVNDVYVPAGWFLAGHRTHRSALPWGWRWEDAFVMRRFPFTYGEMKELLEFVLKTEGEEAALALVPEYEKIFNHLEMSPSFQLISHRFELRPDHDGSVPSLRAPVYAVSQGLSRAIGAPYGRLRGEVGWGIPEEKTWEKGARGVDGRYFPWGQTIDPIWCWNRHSGPVSEMLPVGRYGTDSSPYGVRDLAGGLFDWCVASEGGLVTKGGAWNRNDEACSGYFRWKTKEDLSIAAAGARFARRL